MKTVRREMLEIEKSEAFYMKMYNAINGLMFGALPLIVLLAGFLFLQFGQTTLGSIIAFYMYVGNIVEPMLNLADLRISVLTSREQKKLIDEIKAEFAVDLAGNKTASDFTSIVLHDVKHKFAKTEINIKANVDIKSPGLYGISAPSGLGKSTALKILSGLLY